MFKRALLCFLLAFALALGQTVPVDPTLPPTQPAPQPPAETQPETEPPIEETIVVTDTEVETDTRIETVTETEPVPTITVVETRTQTAIEETEEPTVPEPEPTPEPEPEPTIPLPEPEPEPTPEPEPEPTPEPEPEPELPFVCESDECCEEQAEEGLFGLRFNDRCLEGGLHCLQSTGCEVCMREQFVNETLLEDFNITLMRPICEGPETCGTQECCDELEQVANQSLRVSGRCLIGGPRCFEQTGCEACAEDPEDADETLIPCDPEAICQNQICCSARAEPNPETGSGYLAYDPACTSEETLTEHCEGVTGCKLCFVPPEEGEGENVGERPECEDVLDNGLTPELMQMFDNEDQLSSAASFLGGVGIALAYFVARA